MRRAAGAVAATAGALMVAAGMVLPGLVSAAEPPCTTPSSADGHEPPCNPALAQSPWSASHRGSYAQASSPLPGPRPGRATTARHTTLRGVPIQIQFSEPYPDGGVVAWMSMVSSPDREAIVKVDAATGQVIDEWDAQGDEGRPATRFGSISGAYNLLDRDGHLIVGRANALEVFGDATPGDRRSPIRLLRRFAIPPEVLCGDGDSLVGITMLYDGRVAFATRYGVVGVVPRRPEAMTAANLRTHSLNGERCGDDGAELEEVSNSIAADETHGVYVVTSKAQYRLSAKNDRLGPSWRAAYRTGGGDGGARLGSGSGSTPTLMGRRGEDRFVVITDGQDLMHLVLMWRGTIPRSWKGLPDRDRRIACEVPVTFGDPDAEESISEQSVLVRGHAAVVVNNALALDDVFGPLPEQVKPFSVLSGQVPGNAAPGIERIDWDPKTRTCRTRWATRELTIPNGIPTMSAETGLFYGIGLRGATWGLEGVDFATGRSRLWAPAGAPPNENSFFAATEVGPDGTVWTGTFLGLTTYVQR